MPWSLDPQYKLACSQSKSIAKSDSTRFDEEALSREREVLAVGYGDGRMELKKVDLEVNLDADRRNACGGGARGSQSSPRLLFTHGEVMNFNLLPLLGLCIPPPCPYPCPLHPYPYIRCIRLRLPRYVGSTCGATPWRRIQTREAGGRLFRSSMCSCEPG